MNKNYQLFLVAIAAVFTLTSCATPKDTVETTDAQDTTEVEAMAVAINTDESLITWNGYKSLVDTEHEGTISLSNGNFLINSSDELVGGEFTLDMTTITNTDLEDGAMKDGLMAHLNSEEMYDTANYPEGKFEITKVMPIQENGATHQISGNLTLKGTTKNITFKSNISGLDTEEIQATADFNIDRQLWGIGHSEDPSVLDQVKNNALQNELRIRLDIQS
jgi:polyisoprenoid-binding protein YceI